MTEVTISRDSSNVPTGRAAAFFDEVKNGRDETTEVPGGYGSYPNIYVVTIGDDAYFGFGTNLDDSRGPWLAGYRDSDGNGGSVLDTAVWFERDSVIDAADLEQVGPNSAVAIAVNALIAAERGDDAMTDGGEEVDDSDDSDDEGLGELFS